MTKPDPNAVNMVDRRPATAELAELAKAVLGKSAVACGKPKPPADRRPSGPVRL